jgi:hypothetical protein
MKRNTSNLEVSVFLKSGKKFLCSYSRTTTMTSSSLTAETLHTLIPVDGGRIYVQGDQIEYFFVDQSQLA